MNETFAIEPYVYLYLNNEEDSDSYTDSVKDDNSNTVLGFGSSFLKSAYKNDLITLNFGATAGLKFYLEPTGDDNTDISINGTAIVSMDINVTENLKLRVGHNIVNLYAYTYATDNNDYEFSQNYFSIDTAYNGFSPSFSFYYMF